jgi:uncharacterized protein involved in exopolysaccharide biosynthesis
MNVMEMRAFSLRDLAHLIFKRKSLILTVFIAVLGTVAMGTFLATPIYEAESQILVRIGRENLYSPMLPSNATQAPVISLNREEQINSEIEILRSRSLIEEVAENIGPGIIYKDLREKNEISWLESFLIGITQHEQLPPLQLAALRLEEALTVTAVKKSNVIDIKLRHKDPQMASKVLDRLIALYLDYHLLVHRSPKSYKFFEEQSKTLLSKLKNAEDRLEGVKKEFDVSSFDEEKKLLISQEGALRVELDRTLSQIAETENRIVQINSQLAATQKTVPTEQEIEHSPQLVSSLQTRLVELELKEKELLTKYTDESRLVQQVKEELKLVRSKLNEQDPKQFGRSRSGTNPIYLNLQEGIYKGQADLKALRAKKEIQTTQLVGYRERLEKLNRVETELKEVQRQADVEQQNYKLYLVKLEESRISEAMDTEKISNVTQIQPARTPHKPVSPRVFLNLVIGFFLAMIGSLGLAFFKDAFDDRLEKRDDTERALDLPVLASIPELKI